MDDATGMRVREGRRDRCAVPPCLVPVERAARDNRVERNSVDELEHEHRLAVALEDVVEAHEVRVLEPRECRRLALEPLAQLGVVGDPGVQDLEGDVAAQPLVTRPPDHAHAAAPDLRAEAIAVGEDVVDVLHAWHLHRRAGRP